MRRLATRLVIPALGLAALVAAPVAHAIPAGTTLLIDRPASGPLPFDGTDDSTIRGPRSASADGCLVAFSSRADSLIPGDEDAAQNIYRLDRCTPGSPPQLVSTTSSGAAMEPLAYARGASVSANGRYVAFLATSEVLAPGSAGVEQAFRKDMTTGALDIVSRSTGPAGALAGASEAVISGDGGTVAFISSGAVTAGNVSGTAGSSNAYVRTLLGGGTSMVSLTSADVAGGLVTAIDINHFGDRVAFITSAKLVASDTDAGSDAYIRQGINADGSITRLVSFSGGGQIAGADQADGGAGVGISSEGVRSTWVAGSSVVSAACTPVCGVAAAHSIPGTGGSSSGQDSRPFFPHSLTGPTPGSPVVVAWLSSKPLVASDTGGTVDLYRHSISDGTGASTMNMTEGAANGDISAADLSDQQGTRLVFSTYAATNLPGTDGVISQLFGGPGTPQPLSNPAGVAAQVLGASMERVHAVSDNGTKVVFSVSSSALGSPPSADGPVNEVFLRDTATGAITMLSSAGGVPADDYSGGGSIDAAGTKVVFSSRAGNLLPGTPGGMPHVYLKDLITGELRRLDRTATGAAPNGSADSPQISADGTKVAFAGRATDQVGSPGGGYIHIYLVDLASGATTLVDRTTAGTAGDSYAGQPDLNSDGSVVAFGSQSKNLGGPTDGSGAVYVFRVATHELTHASLPSGDGVFTYASGPALSRDGSKLAFGAQGSGPTRVYVRDLGSGQTTRVSVDTGLPDAARTDWPSISADGNRVAFAASDVPGAFVRDVGAGTTRRIDLANGSATPGRLPSGPVSLDGSGRCAAFVSRSDNLVSPSYGPDYGHVFLRAVDDCPFVPSGPPVTQPIAARDKTRPVISKLALSNRRFALGTKRTAGSARVKPRRGTAFRFRLSETAGLKITIAAKLAGRRSGKRCVKPRRGLKRRCTRLVTAMALTRRSVKAGAASVAFSGRVGKRKLKPGGYRATLVATDPAGNRSAARTVDFTVVRG